MKLSTVRVGVPIFWLQASVEHSVVRKPTVFERMIMRLSRRGVENRVVGETTLRAAFADLLGATGIPRLLESSANELLRLGIIQRADTAAGVSVLDQPIRTLTLSPTGEEFYNRNTLPSHPTRDAADFYYLPWSNSLASERPSKLGESPPALAFDARTLSPRDPSSLVRATLKELPPRFLRGESRIITVEVDVDETVSWLNLDVDLVVTPEGYLELHVAGNKAATDWLTRLEPTIVQTTLLDQILTRAPRRDVIFPSDTSRHIQALELTDLAPVSVSAVVRLPDLQKQLWLSDDHTATDWVPNAEDGLAVGSPLPAGLPNGLTSVTLSGGRAVACQLTGELPLTWAGRQVFAPVRVDLDAERAGPAWDAFSDALAIDLARTKDPGIAALPLAWSSVRPVQALASGANGRTLSEVLQVSRDFVLAARDIAPSSLERQAPALLEVIADLLPSASMHEPVGVGTLGGWAKTMRGALGENAPLETALVPLLDCVDEPTTTIEVREVLQLGRLAGSLPAHLFDAEVQAALLADLWRDPTVDLGAPDFDALQPITRFAVAQAELDATLGRHNAALAQGSGGLTSNGSIGAALQAADRWLHVMEDPDLARSVEGHLPAGLVAFRDVVLKWRDTAAANMAPLLAPGEGALVFDTNSLIDDPQCLRHLSLDPPMNLGWAVLA